MKDRNVEFPNRYRLVRVEGTDDIFDLVPTPGEISDEGTFINKATLLKDATANLFGLDADAVPNDVFGVLSRFQSSLGNEYVWSKNGQIPVPTAGASTSRVEFAKGSVIFISDKCVVVDGVVELLNPKKYTYYNDSNGYTIIDVSWSNSLYFSISQNGEPVYQYASHGTGFGSSNVNGYLMSVGVKLGLVGYVNSPDPNAYPVDDGYTYTALGQLGNKVQIATGSYTGTGTYGASKPNSLTFDFAPVMVFVYDTEVSIGNANTFVAFIGATVSSGENSNNTRFYTLNKKMLSWYNNKSVTGQLNNSGTTYNYIAIG